jgi:hypothetical protein
LSQLLGKLASETTGMTQFREVAGDLEEAFISATQTSKADQGSAVQAAEGAVASGEAQGAAS